MSQFADYSEIDPVLDDWANRQGVAWVRNDRGWDVRTLNWRLPRAESVQLWVDEPADSKAAVHVCHNTPKGGQQHTQVIAHFADLDRVLDESLDRAEAMANELGMVR